MGRRFFREGPDRILARHDATRHVPASHCLLTPRRVFDHVGEETMEFRMRTVGMGNDYFMVPRVQLAMRLKGFDKETLDQVFFQTPRDSFHVPVE